MIDRLKHSMRALQMLMRNQEVTANNLANMNTPGFKADRVFFRSFMDQYEGRDVVSPTPHQTISMEQGAFEATGNQFDFAISGQGFFKVEYDGDSLLTRNGRFNLNNEGFLVDENGAFLQGQSGAVQIPTQLMDNENDAAGLNIEVAKDGTVRVNDRLIDRVGIVLPENIENLERRTNAYLAVPEDERVQIAPNAELVQGYYESGNVNPLTEMVDMTKNLQLFESQQKIMRTTDDILSQVTTRLGRF